MQKLLKYKYLEILYILITAIIAITICSQSSFLYPTNFWVDTNTIFTVGRNLDTKVMYRDLYDQKGPWLFIIYFIASLIQKNNFLGLYIIEILFSFSFLYISYKSICLFHKKYALAVIPIIATVIYSSKSFMWGGSAEELTLVFNAYIMYLVLRAYKNNLMPSNKEFILSGLCSGLIFYIKFSLLGAIFGLVLAFFIISIFTKQLKTFFCKLGYVIIGYAIASIIPIGYFIYHGALKDFFIGYIYDNVFNYNPSTINNPKLSNNFILNILLKIAKFSKAFVLDNRYFAIFLALSIIFTLYFTYKHSKKYVFVFLLSYFCTFAIYLGNKRYEYYELVFGVFAILSSIPMLYFLNFIVSKIKLGKYFTCVILSISIVICTVFCLRWSTSTFLMGVDKDELPQYKFAKIIKSYPKGNLLNINTLDGGIYLACDIVPDRKYFCILNARMDEIFAEHNKAIANGDYEWIYAKYEPIESEKYELVAHELYYYNYHDITDYYLYKRK